MIPGLSGSKRKSWPGTSAVAFPQQIVCKLESVERELSNKSTRDQWDQESREKSLFANLVEAKKSFYAELIDIVLLLSTMSLWEEQADETCTKLTAQ